MEDKFDLLEVDGHHLNLYPKDLGSASNLRKPLAIIESPRSMRFIHV